MPDPVYLDFNATTPVAPELLDAMLPRLRGEFGNPSSTHPYGRRSVLVPRWPRAIAEIVRVSRRRFALGLLNRLGLL